MQLPGRLGATTLGDLLGALHRERCTGTLRLVEQNGTHAGRNHEVSLRAGLVAGVSTDLPTSRLGELLTSRGVIDEAVRRGALERTAGTPGARIGQLLAGEFGVPNREILRALRSQLRARLEALFSIAEARISFHVARRPEGTGPMPLLAAEFLHGRARRRGVVEARPAEPSRVEPGRVQPCRAAEVASARVDPDRASALSLFGLDQTATRRDVVSRFRALARSLHPDRAPRDADGSGSHFAELSAAYHRLIDCR